LERAGLACFDLADDEEEGQANIRAALAVQKAIDQRAALLIVMEQVRVLTYCGADRLHNMTMKEKARFLASSLVAIATVASAAINEASGPDCRPTNS
jgi:thiamine monophosphate synthase